MPAQLPPRPNLEHLRNEARELQRRARSGDASAIDDVRAHHPERAGDATSLKLADAQLVVARRYGFASWNRLRAFVDDVGLMAEDYFLYMEDLDWGRRRGKHRIGFASKAVIRHIGGTTIGSAVAPEKRSHLSIYLSARNGILYARRFAGWR